MKLFRKSQPIPPAPPSFGEWLVTRFTGNEPAAQIPFSKLEQMCSNVGSLLCGAVLAQPAIFRETVTLDLEALTEAGLVARRTADGFRAALEDRNHSVLSWPWDHLATRVAWLATQRGAVSEQAVGDELLRIGSAYAIAHREQLESVCSVWEQVVAGLRPGEDTSLTRMGQDMVTAYQAELLQLAAD